MNAELATVCIVLFLTAAFILTLVEANTRHKERRRLLNELDAEMTKLKRNLNKMKRNLNKILEDINGR